MTGPSITTGPEGPSISLVREAKAVKPTPVYVKGVKVYKLTLTKPLSKLDKESKKYRKAINILKVKNDKLESTVGLNGSGKMITLSFPKSKTDSTARYAGFKLDKFVKLVKKVSGRTPVKAKLVVEFDREKNGERVINIYAIPLDSKGNVLGKLSSGQLAWGVSYYPTRKPGNRVFGAKALLADPRKASVGAVASAED